MKRILCITCCLLLALLPLTGVSADERPLLPIPLDAEGLTIAQVDGCEQATFTYFDTQYVLRAKKTASLEDISGVTIDFSTASEGNVLGRMDTYEAVLEQNPGAQSRAIWYDDARGTSVSVYAESAPDEDFEGVLQIVAWQMEIGLGYMGVAQTENGIAYPVLMLGTQAATDQANATIVRFATALGQTVTHASYYGEQGGLGMLSLLFATESSADDGPYDSMVFHVLNLSLDSGASMGLASVDIADALRSYNNIASGASLIDHIVALYQEDPTMLLEYNYEMEPEEADILFDEQLAYLSSMTADDLRAKLTAAVFSPDAQTVPEVCFLMAEDLEMVYVNVMLPCPHAMGDQLSLTLELYTVDLLMAD